MLMQKQNHDIKKPIAYLSGALADPKENFDATNHECLAVLCAVELLHPYLDR